MIIKDYFVNRNNAKNKPFIYEDINLKSLIHRSELFKVVKAYFMRRGKKLNFYNSDSELYSFY